MNVIIKADGSITPYEPKNGTDYQLEEMQEIVGGWIEILYMDNDHIMVVNEEGKSHGLPINSKATYLVQNHSRYYDVIVGNVLLCERDKVK